ncbi:helix-turn-helix transcriptional regulator [Shewanella atlantica]|uniref:helix-turn-helix transcriptional regulator n=1 Tax=Shewanella atlantica TaxID=271099 RepID=UPI003734E42F
MDYEMLKDVLKASRNKLNLKQSEVAEMVGVTAQTYLKWENGHSEPKASQAGKLAKALNITEKEICQGEIQNLKMDPLEFVRRVGILMNNVPHTEMLMGMHKYISDTDGFIKMLDKVSDYPYELFDIQQANSEKEEELFQAKISLELIEKEGEKIYPDKETMEKVKAHALSVLKKYHEDVRS